MSKIDNIAAFAKATPAIDPVASAPVSMPDDGIIEKTAYAITKWQNGRPTFMKQGGDFTSDVSEAYMLPSAQDFKWCAAARAVGRWPSEITFSVYDHKIPEKKDVVIIPPDDQAPVRGEWRDYVAIVRPVDAEGKIVDRAAPQIVSHHGVRGMDRNHVMTSDPWRAVACPGGVMFPQDIDKTDIYARVYAPHWAAPRRTITLVPRVMTIKPCLGGASST